MRQSRALADKLTLVTGREAERWDVERFGGQSQMLQKILQNIQMLEKADSASVLITGESGTGKELVARAVHAKSARAAVPAQSLLFEHLKGAYTGADDNHAGYFDLADGGTLFLDEIGDMTTNCRSSCCGCSRTGRSCRSVPGAPTRSTSASSGPPTSACSNASARAGFGRTSIYRIARFTVRYRRCVTAARTFRSWPLQLFAEEMGIPRCRP